MIEKTISDIAKEIAENNPPTELENQQTSNTKTKGEENELL
jgi:hypothetical protein